MGATGEQELRFMFWMCIRIPTGCVSGAVGYINSKFSGELRDGDVNMGHG